MEKNNIKQVIEDELSGFVVTERLKQQTLERIHSPKRQHRHFFNVKLSLVSSLIVVLIMGINLVIPKGNGGATTNALIAPSSNDAFPEADYYNPSEKATTTTTTPPDEN